MNLAEATRRLELEHPGFSITYVTDWLPRFEIGAGDERLGWVEFEDGGELGRLVVVARPRRRGKVERWRGIG